MPSEPGLRKATAAGMLLIIFPAPSAWFVSAGYTIALAMPPPPPCKEEMKTMRVCPSLLREVEFALGRSPAKDKLPTHAGPTTSREALKHGGEQRKVYRVIMDTILWYMEFRASYGGRRFLAHPASQTNIKSHSCRPP